MRQRNQRLVKQQREWDINATCIGCEYVTPSLPISTFPSPQFTLNSSFFESAERHGGHHRLARPAYSHLEGSYFPSTLLSLDNYFDEIMMSISSHRIPVLLLKTKSTPDDSYEGYFSNEPFTPAFVPVLEHRPNGRNLDFIQSLLLDGKLGRDPDAKYGGVIFTSQRAVEGFAKVVDGIEANRRDSYGLFPKRDSVLALICNGWPCKSDQDPDANHDKATTNTSAPPFPLYVVGPATSLTLNSVLSSSSRSLHSIVAPLNPQIFGSHTGNGENLAHYILQHYHSLPGPNNTLPLLFLVGEQRRDIIPKTLMDPTLPEDRQIRVDELVVYETGVMESFAREFAAQISRIESEALSALAVVVVFSPSGCEAMLRCLGYIDDENKLTEKGKNRGIEPRKVELQPDGRARYIVATIGPTTRDYLRKRFGYEADVCAEKPSPEGVGEGLKNFLNKMRVLGHVTTE
jgi:uroporphyrinogen-III synthase